MSSFVDSGETIYRIPAGSELTAPTWTQTISLTTPSIGSYILVFVVGTATSVTCSGATMTQLASLSGTYPIKAYGGLCLSTGVQTITIKGDRGVLCGAHALAFDHCVAELAASQVTEAALSVTPNNNSDMYVDCVVETWATSTLSSTLTAGAGQTKRTQLNYGGFWNYPTTPATYPPASNVSYKTSSTADTMAWTFSQAATGGAHLVMRLIPYSPFVGRGTIIQ